MSVFAEAQKPLVSAEVDPEQRDADDRELREPVRPRRRLDQERRPLDRALESQLHHRVQLALDVDDPAAVRERLGRAAVVGDAARRLVGEVEADPDRELKAEVGPAAR